MTNIKHFPFQDRILLKFLNDERKGKRLIDDIFNTNKKVICVSVAKKEGDANEKIL